jgi:hypothetical protein
MMPALGIGAVAVLAAALWWIAGRNGPDGSALGVEAGLWRVGSTTDQRLVGGERIRPGDHLYLDVSVEEPAWVYVVNADDTGAAYLLFPVAGVQHGNPLPPGRHRLPGSTDWTYDSWEVSSAGGRESFVIVAAGRPLERLESAIAGLRRASPDGPSRVSKEVVDALRGVGKLSKSERPGGDRDGVAEVREAIAELTAAPLERDDLRVMEIVLQNP